MVESFMIGVILLALVVAALGGHILVVDAPRRAEVIVVVGGEGYVRVQHGLQLLREGFAPRLVITGRTTWHLYKWSEADLARQFVEQLEPELAERTTVLNIASQCTWEEAAEVREFLAQMGVRSALLVTSQYHSRRALSIFRRMLPGIAWGIAAAPEPDLFGAHWWQHREWAKVTFQEWIRLLWWQAVDRWIAPRPAAGLPGSHADAITLSGAASRKK